MGTRTNISGYVFSDTVHDEQNSRILKSFSYDDIYPLGAVFSSPIASYQGSMISFATSIKATRDEWDEWLDAFEKLFASLCARSARVTLEEADAGRVVNYNYLITGRDEEGTHISRWMSTSGAEEQETNLIL